ncbi:MAG: bifunctional adenosylcobinamide kinase/adenosylcobinamide-phosphate guanylyltransferase [Chloroflexi bacterium]|nr:bifunctional adenosylcobinamide kinase/adenosylcobinamide-phosphate guanylyltransferase [Chloroflexota bacterium]MDA1003928.1 bifunctional adenosylcobinamide kinase/adenosylcobinamide-phosphate guanylyltransferase [Chloroflexota bacterium]MQC27936.1 bifunctional adenosylcobinamide kinase/adenosylcobinamide-phosphate guanylyltransferase [Chloroflexota bacterium]
MGALWFVTGGARSGKSTFAEHLAADTARPVVYVATLEPLDEEMRLRIARHRDQRPAAWRTIEAPRAVTAAIVGAGDRPCVVLDCLSLWLTNRLLDEAGDEPSATDGERVEAMLDGELQALLGAIAARGGTTVIVSNEVGSGIVPPTPLGRVYRDLLGRANQAVSRRADRAWLLVSGRALELPPPA